MKFCLGYGDDFINFQRVSNGHEVDILRHKQLKGKRLCPAKSLQLNRWFKV